MKAVPLCPQDSGTCRCFGVHGVRDKNRSEDISEQGDPEGFAADAPPTALCHGAAEPNAERSRDLAEPSQNFINRYF